MIKLFSDVFNENKKCKINKELLVLGAYVKSSSYRLKVVNCLLEHNYLTPMEIAHHASIRPTHVSNVLSNLKEHEVVECLNEEAHKGRLYCLTDDGLMLKEVL